MKRIGLWSALVVVWLLLVDTITLGQVIAAMALAALLLVLVPATPAHDEEQPTLVLRPLGALRLLGWFAWQLAVSNAQVARAVLFPRRWVRPGTVRVPLRTTSRSTAALVSNITALTPGMQPVDGSSAPYAVHVHVLSMTTPDEVRELIWGLEARVRRAFDPTWEGDR